MKAKMLTPEEVEHVREHLALALSEKVNNTFDRETYEFTLKLIIEEWKAFRKFERERWEKVPAMLKKLGEL